MTHGAISIYSIGAGIYQYWPPDYLYADEIGCLNKNGAIYE